MTDSDTKISDDVYFAMLSEYGKSVFNETLSDLSRQRQTSLLASSLITILLSLSIIGNVETDFFGIKFTFNNVEVIPIIAVLVCLYFLVTYLVGVSQDWQQARYSTMSTQIDIQNLSNKISLANLERVRQSATFMNEIVENLAKNNNAFSDIFKEIEEIRKRQQSEIDEINKSEPNFPGMGSMILSAKHQAELEPLYEKLSNFSKSDDPLGKKINSHLSDTSLAGKAELLNETRREYQSLKNANVIIQIIFPCLLAEFAIGSAIWKLWR